MDMLVTPVGKIFKPRLREIAAEAAAPGAVCNVAAAHSERGLTLSVRVPVSGVEAARAAVGRLPVATQALSSGNWL